ncbi:uncharacterized protein LOC127368353 [Dicentrarchus labrax]|uniref:uncharacterized protein LOC127368353 n=1 Tax=Dicentrarchus labrax TaxID=13489 RepID=UPI0021F61DF3|nr:uncharacterized protein LOC127368353 [Dicentrarchus labrax]
MAKTFSYRRQEVVRDKPLIAEFKLRWPGPFTVAEKYEVLYVSICSPKVFLYLLHGAEEEISQAILTDPDPPDWVPQDATEQLDEPSSAPVEPPIGPVAPPDPQQTLAPPDPPAAPTGPLMAQPDPPVAVATFYPTATSATSVKSLTRPPAAPTGPSTSGPHSSVGTPAAPVSLEKDDIVEEGCSAPSAVLRRKRKGTKIEAGGVGAVQTLWKGLAFGVGAGERHHFLMLPKCRTDCSALVFVMLFYLFVLHCRQLLPLEAMSPDL